MGETFDFGMAICLLKEGRVVGWLASQTDMLAEDWVKVD